MKIDSKRGSGYFDKFHNEISVGDYLIFENGSKYIVFVEENKVILKSLSNNNLPAILISKITYGKTLCSASIVSN